MRGRIRSELTNALHYSRYVYRVPVTRKKKKKNTITKPLRTDAVAWELGEFCRSVENIVAVVVVDSLRRCCCCCRRRRRRGPCSKPYERGLTAVHDETLLVDDRFPGVRIRSDTAGT